MNGCKLSTFYYRKRQKQEYQVQTKYQQKKVEFDVNCEWKRCWKKIQRSLLLKKGLFSNLFQHYKLTLMTSGILNIWLFIQYINSVFKKEKNVALQGKQMCKTCGNKNNILYFEIWLTKLFTKWTTIKKKEKLKIRNKRIFIKVTEFWFFLCIFANSN